MSDKSTSTGKHHEPAEKSPPPDRLLVFFLKTGLFAALMLLGTAILLNTRPETKSFGDHAVELVEQFGQAAKPGEVTMVMLGDSRTRYAWRYGDDPLQTIELPDGRVLRNVKITHNAGVFEHFEGLRDLLLDIRPDIVVIQKTLLVRRARETSTISRLRKLPATVARDAVISSIEEGFEWEQHQTARPCSHNYSASGFESRARSQFMTAPPEFGPQMKQRAADIIQPLLDAGIRVVILHIPPNSQNAELLGVDPILLDNLYLETQPENNQLVPADMLDRLVWLSYPDPGRLEDYCDNTHLDKEQSEKFAAWMKSRIMRIYP